MALGGRARRVRPQGVEAAGAGRERGGRSGVLRGEKVFFFFSFFFSIFFLYSSSFLSFFFFSNSLSNSFQIKSNEWKKNEPNQIAQVEHVACGAGLERIYAFLSSDDNFSSSPSSSSSSSSSSSPSSSSSVLSPRVAAPAITAAAALGSDRVAVEAVEMFLSILGAEAGAMALRSLATGGVYLCGGITAKLAKATRGGGGGNGNGSSSSTLTLATGGLLSPSPLLDSFLWKRSKFGKLLSTIPFTAVLDDGLGLRGARVFASRSLTRAQAEE